MVLEHFPHGQFHLTVHRDLQVLMDLWVQQEQPEMPDQLVQLVLLEQMEQMEPLVLLELLGQQDL